MAKRELTRQEYIERSIITTYRSKLWAPFIKALKEYELIKPKDSICVCISGGKDSMLLAKLFMELKKHSDFDFDVTFFVMGKSFSSYPTTTRPSHLPSALFLRSPLPFFRFGIVIFPFLLHQ